MDERKKLSEAISEYETGQTAEKRAENVLKERQALTSHAKKNLIRAIKAAGSKQIVRGEKRYWVTSDAESGKNSMLHVDQFDGIILNGGQ